MTAIILYRSEDYDSNKVPVLKLIGQIWEDLCYISPDEGSCAIGYGMCFTYEGQAYKMIPRSNKQGEWSWERWVETIKKYLIMAGCTDIIWRCGRLD